MKLRLLALFALLLCGCAQQQPTPPARNSWLLPATEPINSDFYHHATDNWSLLAENAAQQYGVDPRLISAIIDVESGGNPKVVSRSNAIGLMQIKASTAGREVYQLKGRRGEPSKQELQDPARNIDIGTAYLRHLQNTALFGIKNPKTLRYATIVAYANGAGALLRTFSKNRTRAIAMINQMTPEEFYRHVQLKHPAPQAPRYLWKVNKVYQQS